MPHSAQTSAAPSFEDLAFPISQAVVHGDTVYVSGQLGLDPDRLEIVDGGVEAETRQALRNVAAILEAAGGSLDDAVKVTIYHADMDDLRASMDEYEAFVLEPYPARSTVEVQQLPLGASIEIDVTAAR